MARLLPIKISTVLVCMAVLVAACADSPSVTPAPNATFTLVPPTETPIPVTRTPRPTPDLELVDPNSFLTHTPNDDTLLPISASQSVQAAVTDLRSITGIEAIQLLSLKSVGWQDRGLECSDEELSSAELTPRGQVPGYRIVLGNDKSVYIYHSDINGVIILCPDADLFSEEGTPLFVDPATESLSVAARADLAETLDVDSSTIDVVDITFLVWPDTSLGCPLPDVDYRDAEIIGYRLLLKNEDERYLYHTDGLQVQFCPAEQEVLPPPFEEANLETLPTPTSTVTP